MLSTPSSDLIGDRFRVEEELGRGAMGIVVRAYDVTTGNMVAVKRMLVISADAPRFVREAEVLRKLDHPGIALRYIAHGTDALGPWITMDWSTDSWRWR